MEDVWLFLISVTAIGFIIGFVQAMAKDVSQSYFKKNKAIFDRRCVEALKRYANLREANKSITTTYGSELVVKYTTV